MVTYIGCCTHVIDLSFRLSRVRGTYSTARARARVTRVRVFNREALGVHVPRVGHVGTLRLKRGIITEPFLGWDFCDAANAGKCGPDHRGWMFAKRVATSAYGSRGAPLSIGIDSNRRIADDRTRIRRRPIPAGQPAAPVRQSTPPTKPSSRGRRPDLRAGSMLAPIGVGARTMRRHRRAAPNA